MKERERETRHAERGKRNCKMCYSHFLKSISGKIALVRMMQSI